MGLFRKKNSLAPKIDPVDALAGLSGLAGEQAMVLASLLLDYSGGGILSSSQAIDVLQRIPTEYQKQELGDIAKSMNEAFAVSGGSNMSEGLSHGIMVSSMLDLLGKEINDLKEIHRILSSATTQAMGTLLHRRMPQEAYYVALLGCCLYLNAEDWENLRDPT